MCSPPHAKGALTLRSKRPPPATRLGRKALVLIIRLAAQALRRRGRLSSNVRRTGAVASFLDTPRHLKNASNQNSFSGYLFNGSGFN